MIRLKLGLLAAGVLLIGAALVGTAFIFKDRFAGARAAVAMPATAPPRAAARFTERERTDFRITQPAVYEFDPSQATRDLATRHAAWHGARRRVWYEVVPERGGNAMPLVVLLHGAGRDGLSLIEMWKDVAAREGIALLAPDGIESTWQLDLADPAFLIDLVDKMAQTQDIDRDRVYLFGHSSGAAYAQYLLNRVEGPWDAAALHAGYAPLDVLKPPEQAKPFRLYIGTKEHIFSLDTAREMGQALAQMGHDNELAVIPGHTHWLYEAGPQIAADAWKWMGELPH